MEEKFPPEPAMPQDDFKLQRFVDAQDKVIGDVRAELRAGRKTSHWIWFVFPQIEGLGVSPTAAFYAIASLAEAEAYLTHPVLGARLRECTGLVNAVEGRTLKEIFGDPDAMKFRSSMTLFDLVSTEDTVFSLALQKYCGGKGDPATLTRLCP
jgi:uncharacterized protein (DUF1810 family)